MTACPCAFSLLNVTLNVFKVMEDCNLLASCKLSNWAFEHVVCHQIHIHLPILLCICTHWILLQNSLNMLIKSQTQQTNVSQMRKQIIGHSNWTIRRIQEKGNRTHFVLVCANHYGNFPLALLPSMRQHHLQSACEPRNARLFWWKTKRYLQCLVRIWCRTLLDHP